MSGHLLDVVLAAEQRQRAAMDAHLALAADARDIWHASSPFWPLMLTVRGYVAWEDLERREGVARRREARAARRAARSGRS
jgi:hypothetical protein